jgi:outer membrane lipoprotein-sorting protein
MCFTVKRSAVLVCLVMLGGAAARSATPVTAGAILARARAYLGDDAALSAVHSVHFKGVIKSQKVTPTGLVPQKAGIEIFFQKPFQQRIIITGAENIESTGLDGYDAWQREQSLADPSKERLTALGPDTIKWLRATAWENLNFYKGIEEQGGAMEVIGDTTVDGHPAVKVAMTHAAGIVFYHSFDAATGRLLFTETRDRTTREEGEILVDGLRFSQIETQTFKGLDASGRPVERKMVITFDKITLNETFPDSFFEMPLPRAPGSLRTANPPVPQAPPAADEAPAAAK